jgi:hypothetical protein
MHNYSILRMSRSIPPGALVTSWLPNGAIALVAISTTAEVRDPDQRFSGIAATSQ